MLQQFVRKLRQEAVVGGQALESPWEVCLVALAAGLEL